MLDPRIELLNGSGNGRGYYVHNYAIAANSREEAEQLTGRIPCMGFRQVHVLPVPMDDGRWYVTVDEDSGD